MHHHCSVLLVLIARFCYYQEMIAVIIAGGSGTRLWPLSTPDYPKHLLQVNDDKLSLLQHAYRRAKRLTDKVYVVSEVGHIKHVKRQLPDLPAKSFIIEPGRRGTANCIIAALARISADHDDDEPIAFMHSDHFIRDIRGFAYSFRLAEKVSAREKRITLIGIEPDRPATIFGYIEKGDPLDANGLVFNVSSFKEKPDHPTARQYLRSGNYLWNGGYFVGSVAVFIENMKQVAPKLAENYLKLKDAKSEQYEKIYLSFETEAIDYALIEKLSDLLVVPASFDWIDLGSFSDLSKAVGGDVLGNHLQGNVVAEETKHSFVQNNEAKPLVVVGLDNVIVVNTPNGLLVTRKDTSYKVGDISKRLNEESK